MSTLPNSVPVQFISLVDNKVSNLELFKNLYQPKYTQAQLQAKEVDINVYNFSNNRYVHTIPSPLYVNPTPNCYNQTDHYYSGRDERTSLYQLILPIDTRSMQSYSRNHLVNAITSNFNLDKLFNYNLETHQNLISQYNYVPLIVNKKFIFEGLPRWLNATNSQAHQLAIIDFQEWIDGIEFVYWKKVDHTFIPQTGPFQNKRIFSWISKPVFDAFENNFLNVTPDGTIHEISQPYDLFSYKSQRQQNRSYWHSRRNNHNFDTESLEKCINTNLFGDLCFLKDYYITNSTTNPETQEEENETLPFPSFLINDIFKKKRIKVLKVPSWKTKSNDSKIEFSSYTKSQFLKRQTSFAAIVYQHPCFDFNLNKRNANFFSLLSASSHSELSVRGRINERIVSLFKSLLWKDGVKLYDEDKAQQILNSMFQGLNRYSNLLIEDCDEQVLNELATIQNEYSPLNSHQNASLTLTPKVDPALESKYKKLHLNIQTHTENLAYDSNLHRRMSSASRNLTHVLTNLKNAQDELNEIINTNCLTLQNIYSAAEFIKRNQSIYQSISNKYLKAYEDSLLTQEYQTDSFFENLSLDNIKLIDIQYNSKKINLESNSEALTSYSRARNAEDNFNLEKITFLIDRPVKIKVDSNDTKIHAGGPYIVQASPDNIHIKLAYNYSLFGKDQSTFCVHPHTSSHNSLTRLFTEYSRGCLGEAQALLYNAFKKNDLKLIVLACMTWVTSANSSDPWGRKYSWFLPYTDIDPTQKNDSLKEEDVGDFLQAICEEDQGEIDQESFQEPNPTTNLNGHSFDPAAYALHNPAVQELEQNNTVPNMPPQEVSQTVTNGWNPQDFANVQPAYTPFNRGN